MTHCKEATVRFLSQNHNTQHISASEVSGATMLIVYQALGILNVEYATFNPNKELLLLKAIAYNMAHVLEYSCDRIFLPSND